MPTDTPLSPATRGNQDPSDESLVTRTLAGELTAFETLVARHRPVVYRVAVRIVGPDEAEDVCQDAFLRAFHRLRSYRGDSPFRPWLLRITHNTALHAIQRRKPTKDPTPHERVVHESPPPVSTPADELEVSERRERLALKVARLSPAHRSVLILRDLEGLSYDEIALVTDAPIGSVKGRLHRAREELIELLRNNTFDWNLPDD